MIIGVPKEVKENEYRVALLPFGVDDLVSMGHQVLVETSAGEGAGVGDEEYVSHGAQLLPHAADIFGRADLILKVKEPMPEEIAMIRENQIVFTYFHFASSRELTEGVSATRCHAIAYETLLDNKGRLPLLTPMSEVAGRMSIQQGAKYLEKPQGGRGLLLGGVPGVRPANVLVLGGGVVGSNAALTAAGMGANVIILETSPERLRYLSDVMPRNVMPLYSNRSAILAQLQNADLVVGAVLIPGGKAPHLVRREDLSLLQPGSVIVDVAIDQGGCIETSRPTKHSQPTFVESGVIHYCVTNMPGAVSRTSTFALCNATFPWVQCLANEGVDAAAANHAAIAHGLNMYRGETVNRAVAETFDLPFSDRFVQYYWPARKF